MSLALITMMLIPFGQTKADLQFQYSVEQFVIASAPGHPIPQPYRNLVENLGGQFWANREAASDLLEARIQPHARWLIWARKHRDLEIRARVNILMAKVSGCHACWGSGECFVFEWAKPKDYASIPNLCVRCGELEWKHVSERFACQHCGGSGSSWTRGIFE